MAKRRRRQRARPATQLLRANELRDLLARFQRDELDQEQTLAELRRLMDKGGNFIARQLVRSMTDSDSERRALATWALISVRDPRSVPALWDLVRDRTQDQMTRLKAWNVLVELGEVDEEAAPPMAIRPGDLMALLDEQIDLVINSVRGMESSDEIETVIGSSFGTLEEEVLLMVVEQLEARADTGAADLLSVLAAVSSSKAGRRAARRALQKLKLRGIHPQLKPAARLGEDKFYKAYVGLMREQGELPLIMGWQRPDGSIQALMFLIDYWGRGIKESFPTHNLSRREFHREVVGSHEKDVPMAEISLVEGKRLVEEGLLYNEWFEEPLPDEFHEYHYMIESKVLEARGQPPPRRRAFVNPELEPAELVNHFLQMPDFGLRYELLTATHPLRQEKSWRQYVEEELELFEQTTPRILSVDVLTTEETADQATVTARLVQEVQVEGHLTLQDALLRFDFVHEEDGWRIAAYAPVSSTQDVLSAEELTQVGEELMQRAAALAEEEQYETAEAHGEIALKRFEQAIALDPDYREAYEGARGAADALGQFDRAMAYCDQMAERFPDKADIYLQKARLCISSIEHEYETPPLGFERQREQQAVEALQASIAHQPIPDAMLFLGHLLEERGRESEATAQYTHARELFPDDLGVMIQWGTIHGNRGELHQALPLFEEVYHRDPTFQYVCYNLGLTWRFLGDLDKAAAFYEEQLRYDPDHAESCNNLAKIYLQRGEHRQAIPLFRKAIALQPDDALFHTNLAATYHVSGQRRKCTAEFRRALELDPDHPLLLSVLESLRPDLLPGRQRPKR